MTIYVRTSLSSDAMSAALLAFVGLYGVSAFGVSRHTSEIGLRMALGARRNAVVRMVLREVVILTVAGVAVALPLTWWLSRLLESQLYGVEPHDPVILATSACFLIVVTVLAGAVPALRASRLSPATVLHYE